eukprot:Opistho-2@52145
MHNPCGSDGSPYTARVHPLDTAETSGAATQRAMSFSSAFAVAAVTHKKADYELLEGIGCNASGHLTVYRARHTPSGQFLVVKRVDLEHGMQRYGNGKPSEVQLSRMLRDCNVTECLASFVADNELWIVMPLMDGGSLAGMLLTREFADGFPETVVAVCIRDVLRALSYLHKNGIIFRNVRPSRMLAHSDGGVRLSNLCNSITLYREGHRARREFVFGSDLSGSIPWVAPEVLQQDLYGYDTSADIYGLGISAIQLATGRLPYGGMEPTQVLLMKLKGRPPTMDDFAGQRKLTRQFRQFVDLCLRRNPRERPTADQLLDHPFVRGGKRKSQVLPALLKALPPLTERSKLECEAIARANNAAGAMRSQVAEAAAAELGDEEPPVFRRSIDELNVHASTTLAKGAAVSSTGSAWVF